MFCYWRDSYFLMFLAYYERTTREIVALRVRTIRAYMHFLYSHILLYLFAYYHIYITHYCLWDFLSFWLVGLRVSWHWSLISHKFLPYVNILCQDDRWSAKFAIWRNSNLLNLLFWLYYMLWYSFDIILLIP